MVYQVSLILVGAFPRAIQHDDGDNDDDDDDADDDEEEVDDDRDVVVMTDDAKFGPSTMLHLKDV